VARRDGEAPVDVVPPAFSVRTRVHEYGGGTYTVDGETVYFCNDADQRVYRVDPGAAPEPITPAPEVPFGLRYADLRVAGDWVVCVRERVAEPEHVNELVAFSTDGRVEPRVIAYGHDFYAAPRISPDGAQLAYLTWDHPRMPWEGTELRLAQFRDGSLHDERVVAGGVADRRQLQAERGARVLVAVDFEYSLRPAQSFDQGGKSPAVVEAMDLQSDRQKSVHDPAMFAP